MEKEQTFHCKGDKQNEWILKRSADKGGSRSLKISPIELEGKKKCVWEVQYHTLSHSRPIKMFLQSFCQISKILCLSETQEDSTQAHNSIVTPKLKPWTDSKV